MSRPLWAPALLVCFRPLSRTSAFLPHMQFPLEHLSPLSFFSSASEMKHLLPEDIFCMNPLPPTPHPAPTHTLALKQISLFILSQYPGLFLYSTFHNL